MAKLTESSRLYLRSRYLLNGNRHLPMAETLRALSRVREARTYQEDWYGMGNLVEELEQDVAKKFGKPAALYFPTGKMAQTAAHLVWKARSGRKHIALHPRCHLELHEAKAYRELTGLKAVSTDIIGRPIKISDRKRKLSATHIEIPTRDFFYAVPTFDELRAAVKAARKNSHALHLDGARIWETLPYYGKSPRQVAALFDSLYVSFYKGIGAISGAMLLGDRKFIDEARTWQHRLGGRTVTHFPVVLSIRESLRKRGDRKFAAYHRSAKELASHFTDLGLECRPPIPRSNAFAVVLPKADPKFTDRRNAVAKKHGLYINARPSRYTDGGEWFLEISAGDETLRVPKKIWQATLSDLFGPLTGISVQNKNVQ